MISSAEQILSVRENILSSFASVLSSAKTTEVGSETLSTPAEEPTLKKLLSKDVTFDKNDGYCEDLCSFPSLDLSGRKTNATVNRNLTLHETAAYNLACAFVADKNDVGLAPGVMIDSLLDSFKSLVEYRMKSSVMALFKNQTMQGNTQEAILMKKLLSNDSSAGELTPISITAIVTSFRSLPRTGPVEDSLYLPLVLEVTVDVSVFGSLQTVTFNSPGTIIGSFSEEDGLLKRVEVLLETIALLNSMMKQARLIVRLTMARATGVAFQVIKGVNQVATSIHPVPSVASVSNSLNPISSCSSLFFSENSKKGSEHRMSQLDLLRKINSQSIPTSITSSGMKNVSFADISSLSRQSSNGSVHVKPNNSPKYTAASMLMGVTTHSNNSSGNSMNSKRSIGSGDLKNETFDTANPVRHHQLTHKLDLKSSLNKRGVGRVGIMKNPFLSVLQTTATKRPSELAGIGVSNMASTTSTTATTTSTAAPTEERRSSFEHNTTNNNPHQLFSWLAGDKMLLQEDTGTPYDNTHKDDSMRPTKRSKS